ncbi:MerR family transcriptional regulator OS=Streptomyces tendae OX=1932 GN=GUR47_22130 PE=4 SV=1 [Streptomyces tendae]
MHRIARFTSDERRRVIADFIAALEAGTPHARDAAAALRAALPELPDEPTDAQLAAWVELAELVADDDFRGRMARAALPPADEDVLPGAAPRRRRTYPLRPAGRRRGQGGGHRSEGDEAAPVVDAVAARCAAVLDRPDGPELREWLAGRFEAGHDPLVERYWRLVWTLNDWQVVPGHLPFQPWLVRALRRPGRVSPSRR